MGNVDCHGHSYATEQTAGLEQGYRGQSITLPSTSKIMTTVDMRKRARALINIGK